MPIYPYRCDACGFRKDVLQKMSDPALTTCPTCGAESFAKQLSAPAFQLKGTGWYVTDFRDNGKKSDPDATKTIPAGEAGPSGTGSTDGGGDRKAGEGNSGEGKSDAKSDGKSDGKSGTPAAAPPAAPAAKTVGSSTAAGSTGSAGSSSSTGPASGGSSAG